MAAPKVCDAAARRGRCASAGRTRDVCGFTLIELLVVIAVIALLVALLMPALRTAKDLALRAKCASRLHAIGLGIHVYAEDWNGWMPYGSTPDGTKVDAYGGGHPEKLMQLLIRKGGLYVGRWPAYPKTPAGDEYAGYVQTRRVLYCPAKTYEYDPYYGSGYFMQRHTGYAYGLPGPGGNRNYSWREASKIWRLRVDREYSIGHLGGVTFRAWTACAAENHFKDLPHRGTGANTLYRTGSVLWIPRPEGGWGTNGWFRGTWFDELPFWALAHSLYQ